MDKRRFYTRQGVCKGLQKQKERRREIFSVAFVRQ